MSVSGCALAHKLPLAIHITLFYFRFALLKCIYHVRRLRVHVNAGSVSYTSTTAPEEKCTVAQLLHPLLLYFHVV